MVEGTIQAFFSYSHRDWKAAERHGPIPNILGHLFDQIEVHVRVAEGTDRFCKWVDQERLRWADQWSDELERAIAASELFFVFLSPGWLNSDVCRRELETFRDRQNGLGGKRVFVAQIQPLTPKQQNEHCQILAELRHLQCKDDWQSLLTADENTRVRACQTAGQEVLAQLETLASAPLPSLPPSSLPSCSPTLVNDHRKLASGKLVLSGQGAVVDGIAVIWLYLAFVGKAIIETQKGALVFGAKSAWLYIYAENADINPHNDFRTNRRSAAIDIKKYLGNGLAYRIESYHELLDENIVSTDSYELPIVHAKITGSESPKISGYVRLEPEDIQIDMGQSEFYEPVDLDSADKNARDSMLAAMARMILEEHFSRFDLIGCTI